MLRKGFLMLRPQGRRHVGLCVEGVRLHWLSAIRHSTRGGLSRFGSTAVGRSSHRGIDVSKLGGLYLHAQVQVLIAEDSIEEKRSKLRKFRTARE